MTLRAWLGTAATHMEDRLGRFRLPAHDGHRPLPLAIVAYHGIGSDPLRQRLSQGMEIAHRACLAEIRFARRQGYAPIAVTDLERPATWPTGARGLLLVTFDDGHANAAPTIEHLLRHEGVPVLLALCPDVVEHQQVFWWEEWRARLAHTRRSVDLTALLEEGGLGAATDVEAVEATGATEAIEERLRAASPATRRATLDALRQRTQDVAPEAVRTSPHVRLPMDEATVRRLVAHGAALAAHALEHDVATAMSPEALAADARACRERLGAWAGTPCDDFVYPNGRHDDRTETTLGAVGYTRTYTTHDHLNRVGDTRRLGRWRGDGWTGRLRLQARRWRARHAGA